MGVSRPVHSGCRRVELHHYGCHDPVQFDLFVQESPPGDGSNRPFGHCLETLYYYILASNSAIDVGIKQTLGRKETFNDGNSRLRWRFWGPAVGLCTVVTGRFRFDEVWAKTGLKRASKLCVYVLFHALSCSFEFF